MQYDTFRALHVIAVIAWMIGLLFLPQLFAYHAGAERGSQESETFKVMERRLLRGIMHPSMALVWLFGLALAWKGEWWHAVWWQVKVILTIALTFVHYLYSRWRMDFEGDRNVRPAGFYRAWIVVSVIPIIAIVFLVYLKPL